MQTVFPDKKGVRQRIVGLYCFVLAIIVIATHDSSPMRISAVFEKQSCSGKGKKAESVFSVNDILFSIKSFSLYDMAEGNP